MRPMEPVGALASFPAVMQGFGHQAVGGDDAVDHSELRGPLGGDGFAGHKKLGGEFFADRTRQKKCSAAIGRKSDADKGLVKARVVRRDNKIAGESEDSFRHRRKLR